MKTSFKFLAFTAVISILASCSDDDTNNNLISEEEVVEIVQRTVASDTYGMAAQIEDASDILDNEISTKINKICGVLQEGSIIAESNPSMVSSYSYSVSYKHEMVCVDNTLSEYLIDFSASGQYTTPRIESNDETILDVAVSNLESQASQYVYNGSFRRDGSQVVRIVAEKVYSSTISIQNSDLLVDKTSFEIVAGTSTFSLTGSSTRGGSFSYNGTIIYNDNGTASIEINGAIYNVVL